MSISMGLVTALYKDKLNRVFLNNACFVKDYVLVRYIQNNPL